MTEAEALDMAAKAAGWEDWEALQLIGRPDTRDHIRAHAATIMELAELMTTCEEATTRMELMYLQHQKVVDENAALKAENERLREEISLLKSLPDDIAETVIKLGPVEWGQTDPKDANGHGESVKNSVELTAAHFQQEGLQPMNGLYLVGEETVVCHTGTSPNSAQVARALTGAWNLMWDHARAALKEIDNEDR